MPPTPGLVYLENDAADFEVINSVRVVTGKDGSPTNFKIVAYLDLTEASIAQRGKATMGWFTNYGTVFTVASTHWALRLGNATIDQITTNILDDLYEVRSRGPASYLTRVYPERDWTQVGAEGLGSEVKAMTGIVQGQLLMERDGSAEAWDPENPEDPPLATQVAALAGLTSYGSDLWGGYIYAGTSDGSCMLAARRFSTRRLPGMVARSRSIRRLKSARYP
jgi:hypothetical protein